MNSNNLVLPEMFIIARDAYQKGENVTNALRKYLKVSYNTPEIIALAYDLQAGTYTNAAESNESFYNHRAQELTTVIEPFCDGMESVLDLGSGEISMFSRLLATLKSQSINKTYAADINWSRLNIGIKATENIVPNSHNLSAFVSDMAKIPLPSKSIDLTFTDHALEPNGSRLEEILKEIFRCTRNICIFTEPSNEIASIEAQERMKKLSYIFDLEQSIKKLGGEILCSSDIFNNYNKLNPARTLVVRPPVLKSEVSIDYSKFYFTFPGTDYELQLIDEHLFCKDMGVVFPIIKDIPILLEEKLIIASKYS
tara:strand:- start:202 stop:1134 length:933 start_codon:yes stop_codon:yes gene_type:complete